MDEMDFGEAPEWMPYNSKRYILEWRDINGISQDTVDAIRDMATSDYEEIFQDEATPEGAEYARYDYLRFAGLDEALATICSLEREGGVARSQHRRKERYNP